MLLSDSTCVFHGFVLSPNRLNKSKCMFSSEAVKIGNASGLFDVEGPVNLKMCASELPTIRFFRVSGGTIQ